MSIENERKTGVGCDALCADDKRLKFKWTWGTFNEGKPSQSSETTLENGWDLRVVAWYKNYEARVQRHGNEIGSYNIDIEEDEIWNPEKLPALLTRIDAQLKAEELFEEIGKDIVRQCEEGGAL